MNRDSQRTSQPADRRVINRSGSVYQRGEEPRATTETSPEPVATTHRNTGAYTNGPQKKRSKATIWVIVAVLLVAAVAVLGWLLVSNNRSGATGIDSSRYQAVFLANGQIYFGKLKDFNDDSFQLSKMYYPQAQATDASGEEAADATQQSNIQLYRVTDGVHGPEDQMIIMKSQILYYENLQENSKVTELINQNEKR